jgi:hypothetical protein
MLVYDGGVTPAAAVDELFERGTLDRLALDCTEYVQLVHLYARRHTFGYDGFHEAVRAAGGMALRMQQSTGYRPVLEYSRSSPSAPMERRTPGGAPVPVDDDVDDLLARAPVGSRVVRRNRRLPGTDSYDENTVTLGADRYAAHGSGRDKEFTRAGLERALARLSYEPSDGDFAASVAGTVFLRKIEHVAVP